LLPWCQQRSDEIVVVGFFSHGSWN
jgi:hypothetical protein